MPDQQVMWTALPRGADATKLKLDVFVSPRLGVDAPVDSYTLAEFGEFEHWTKTVDEHLTFEVELDDGTRHAAEIVPAALDDDAWDHLFRATTFVRPWSFKDLSELPIYSFPARFVTAYLRDLYRDVGQKHPTTPPGRDDLDDLRVPLGPITDVRVPEERRPPPRDPADLPRPDIPPPPAPQPEGCFAGPMRLLRRLCNWLRRLLGMPPLPPPSGPPPDPTPPKVKIPRVVHPSPYGAKPPLTPVVPPPIAAVDAQIAATKVLPPAASVGDMADALAARDPSFDFACVQRFYDRPEAVPPSTPPETDARLPPGDRRPRRLPDADAQARAHRAPANPAPRDRPDLGPRRPLVGRRRPGPRTSPRAPAASSTATASPPPNAAAPSSTAGCSTSPAPTTGWPSTRRSSI